jgi:hypothetical protein
MIGSDMFVVPHIATGRCQRLEYLWREYKRSRPANKPGLLGKLEGAARDFVFLVINS